MRRLSLTAILAVPIFFLSHSEPAQANPFDCTNCGSWMDGRGFRCGGFCYRLFPHIFQEGPLFNYGPYYGYYPFKPYGPWDAYLRYDPFFYGDPSAQGNVYGRHPNLPSLRGNGFALFHKHGCATCGFWHASWLHGGWFRGHAWLHGGFGKSHKPACASCGGVGVTSAVTPTGDATARYSGFGTPEQSAYFYPSTPTLDPELEVMPVSGQSK